MVRKAVQKVAECGIAQKYPDENLDVILLYNYNLYVHLPPATQFISLYFRAVLLFTFSTLALPASLFASPAWPVPAFTRESSSECTYRMQIWNVNAKSCVLQLTVRHDRGSMAASEIDPVTGCSVCSEDQEVVNVPPVEPFSVCYKLAPKVRSLLQDLVNRKAPVYTVTGYHVIKSRGPADAAGNRTEFSNHSYGTALDINADRNGLYDNCTAFGPQCRLLRGGAWHPGTAGALEKGGDIVSLFEQAGFRWGGEIAGKQKDFMHFSPTGY